MYIARKYGDYRLQEIADAFGLRHYGGVSSTIHLVTRELHNDQVLRAGADRVIEKLGIQKCV